MTDAAISQLENRLKAVTSRLEQVEKQLAAGGGSSSSSSSSGGSSGESSAYVSAYEQLISTYIDEYVRLSGVIGDADVQKQAQAVKAAVQAQRDFLEVASKSKKPSDSDFMNLLQPTSKAIEAVGKVNNKGKQHPKFNYLSTLSEGIGALGWVAVTPAPGPAVDDGRASSEFYSNKILMEFKGKPEGDQHRAWVAAWNTFLKELRNYVKQYHTTGVAWNPKGGNASEASAASGGSAPPPPVPSGGGPPAPPPGGGPPAADTGASSGGGGAGSRAAMLAEIEAVKERQKSGRTEGLRKVQAHEKTKNRDPKDVSSVVPAIEPKGAPSKAAGAKPAVTKPPRIELEGSKWVIEWQQGNKNIVIEETETRQTVYIYKCDNSVIQIKGKVNSIAVDGCKKTGIVFENAIAAAEMVNCQSIQLQVLGRVPNIAVDKTDGCQIHLSKDCLDVEIVTSKVSEMNVNIPNPKDPNGDPIERPVPEQFKTVVKGGSLVTEAVQHLA